ncbi:hypothetical protein CR513_20687, partial [Mucuna pruriens]
MFKDKLQVDEGRRKPLEFKEGDHIFLKVSSTTDIGRDIKVIQLNPHFIGPFQILQKFRPMVYRISFPASLSNVHDVFHVSQLRKYVAVPSHIIKTKYS